MINFASIGIALLFFVAIMASVALHEVGHMVPAKLFGVKVTQYFVGFGKTLWSRKRGETEYGFKAFPLGGYVRLVGMYPPQRDTGRKKGWLTRIRPAPMSTRRSLLPMMGACSTRSPSGRR